MKSLSQSVSNVQPTNRNTPGQLMPNRNVDWTVRSRPLLCLSRPDNHCGNC